TIGNHEFDFGHENLSSLRDTYHGKDGFHMVSNNITKNGTDMFDRSVILDKDGHKIAIIGVTTPETYTKTHPNNVIGIDFLDPLTEVKKDLDNYASNTDLDLVVILAHLGDDTDTVDAQRGDILAQELSQLNYDKPILVIDGHSHTKIDPGKFYGDNVLYVQTGEYIKNIGHVEIDTQDFKKSSGKLIATNSLGYTGPNVILDAEVIAENAFDSIGKKVILDYFPIELTSAREIVRTRETALGNLIADSVMAYGKGFSQVPDVAVINGGGIREDLKEGPVTIGDVFAILPFNNMYSSIKVTGQQLVDMFEFSYGAAFTKDEGAHDPFVDGTYRLAPSGGFLHVAGAIVVLNPLNDAGKRVKALYIEDKSRMEESYRPVVLDETYILATNDFLAAGGDDFDMLGGERIEGDGLEEVLVRFFESGLVDFSQYNDGNPARRILLNTITEETEKNLDELLALIDDLDSEDYTEASFASLLNALGDINQYKKGHMYEEDMLDLLDNLESAIEGLELRAEPKPVEPEPTEPKPVETTPETGDKTPSGIDIDKPKGDLPSTGAVSLAYPATILVGIGLIVKAISKRKEE
ncbi:MAG TPA: 5'-nucleotidase C-terminal domain-containing protein, partial [Erysipelothrix sp.]|nr:5'-nucleotidase C-terminal domain-containing protein [Erysipelothrix sp.]